MPLCLAACALQVRRHWCARNPRSGLSLDLDHGGRNSHPHRKVVTYETSAITITLLLATALFIAAARRASTGDRAGLAQYEA